MRSIFVIALDYFASAIPSIRSLKHESTMVIAVDQSVAAMPNVQTLGHDDIFVIAVIIKLLHQIYVMSEYLV